MTLSTISQGKVFKKILNKGKKKVFESFVFIYLKHNNVLESPKIGFITSSKIGKAVIRNRVRRRLKPLARVLINDDFKGFYFCIIGRKNCYSMSYAKIKEEFKEALKGVK